MAATRSYLARAANRRFLPTDQGVAATESMIFELDESDIWSSAAAARSISPEMCKQATRISRMPVSGDGVRPASLPVNVPDWSKILKDEYRENRRQESDDYDYEAEDEDEVAASGGRIPPHEFLARQMARTRIASFSVHEGIGRTLKGRDLSRVRNAVWQKIGFED